MTPIDDLTEAALRMCQACPQTSSRTLARALAKEFHVTIEKARNRVRHVRGANGQKKRRTRAVSAPWKKRKAGISPKMPPSRSESWLPFEVEGPATVLVLSDIHVPFHSERALAAAVDYGLSRNPSIVFINGDFGDWYGLSRFEKSPRIRDDQVELNAQRQCLEWLRHEFPKARIILKYGNHDERWEKHVYNFVPQLHAESMLQLEEILKCADYGVEIVKDQRPVMLGKLTVLHGHELPKGLTNPVNMARGAFLRTNHTVLVGHGHRTSTHSDPDMWHKEVTCWSTGCLCDLRPEYARINKWNHGFAFVTVAKDGIYNVENLRITLAGEVRSA